MSLMSDNEIEDVSFLPGEHLNRGAVYEPNILQKLKLLACNRGRAAVIAVVGCLLLLIIALIAALSNRHCGDTLSDNQEHINDHSGTTIPLSLEDYISTNGKHFPYRDIKLPDSVIPVNYKLFIHPNITNSVFNGTVEMHCHIKKDTDFIVLHVKNLRVTQLEVKEKETGNHVTVTEQLEYKTNEQLYVGMGTRLISGSEVILQMTFDGNLSNKLAGFYKSMYKTSTGEQRFIATTHFEPTDARAAFPCFDEPNLKATFELSIVHEKNYIALSNMPLMKQEKYEIDLLQDTFQQTVKMSTYLVAFVVCDYKNLTQETKRNISVGVYAPANSIYAADFALDTAVKIIDYYEEFFGIHYPLPKLDLIAIPDFAAGAMENWGLITYRMTAILYDPKVNSVANKERVAVVIAHELAHQWFGNLVTMAWWDDLWLNEGFASYVEYIGSGIIDQEWKMQDQFVTDTLLNAMYLDSLENSHPVNLPVSNPNQINELFDAITYDKGASIIRMLNLFLGNEVFKAGLISYLNKYNFSNAATNDLWRSFSQAVTDTHTNLSTEVTTLMRTWTEQTGYPVVTLSRSTTASTVTLTQSRFLLYNHSNITEAVPSPFGYKWEIPFCYYTDTFTQNKILIKDGPVTIKVDNNAKWIKGNCNMSGYYRVNYDEKNWYDLIQQLNRNHTVFSDTERAGLIDDALMLARNGYLKYKLALDLSLYLVNEQSYIPWKTFLDHLGYFWSRFEDKDVYPKFKTFLIKLITNLLHDVVWEDTGTHLEKYLRASVLDLAVKLGHEPMVKEGTKCFQQWKLNNSNININLKSVIYKAGMMYGTADDWEYVLNAFLNESDASESRKLLSALGQTKDVGLLSRLLQYGLNESIIRSQDTITVVATVADSLLGQVLVWPFFKQNWHVFHDRYSTTSFIMSELIKRVTSNLDTKFDFDDVKTFFFTRDVGSGARAVYQSLERIQIHMDWISKYQNEVTDWLNRHGN